MKHIFLYILMIVGLLTACKGDENVEQKNTAPTVPVLISPANNTLCIASDVQFKWEQATDAEKNPVSYKIEVSQSSTFETKDFDKLTISVSELKALEIGKAYFWRVKALDNKGAESEYSPVYTFTTEGVGVSNHLPYAPVLVSPANDAVVNGTSATLSWTAADADNDPLTYDVYLDTVNPPLAKVSENQTATTFEANNLLASKTYYFKVLVKDNQSGQTIGNVWSFSTK